MKGNPEVIRVLQGACRGELQAICQYRTHMHLQKNAGFGKIATKLTAEHMADEERHLNAFMERLADLDAIPDISTMPEPKLGVRLPDQFECDLTGEYSAIEQYRDAYKICYEVGDFTTMKLFMETLAEEEGHANDFETQLSVVKEVGYENYLARHSTLEVK